MKLVNNCYQKHKEKLQKEARERYQNFSEKEKKKRLSLIVNVIKIFLKKETSWLYEKFLFNT